jgi:hypothetical protein
MRALPNWRGRTAVCIASGPSLTVEDCEFVRGAGLPTIVTNTTFRIAPWADVLFGFDYKWWRVHLAEVRATFSGRLFCQSNRWPSRYLEWPGMARGYRSFGNSGANAVSLAVVLGASRVVLLGYDCQLTGGRSHHHGDHPEPFANCDKLPQWPLQFERLGRWASARGIPVVNASRESALTCFDRVPLELALSPARVAA